MLCYRFSHISFGISSNIFMADILPQFSIETKPVAKPEAVIITPRARFTVLTSRLIRMEYSSKGKFEDHPSQVILFREHPVPKFRLVQNENGFELTTSHLILWYRKNPKGFTKATLSVKLIQSGIEWHFGDENNLNLLGTTRTLDNINGEARLENGLISRSGWAIIDDSNTLVFNNSDWLEPRSNPDNLDLYFLGYGNDYRACLRDFRLISGQAPLIPRWFLGNWWSRFWRYSQQDLVSLMQDFKTNQIPLSICIIDMAYCSMEREILLDWVHVEQQSFSQSFCTYPLVASTGVTNSLKSSPR